MIVAWLHQVAEMLGIKHGDPVQVERSPRSHSSGDVVARTYSGNVLPPSTHPIIPTQELPLGEYVVRKVANVRETKDVSSSKVTAEEPLRQASLPRLQSRVLCCWSFALYDCFVFCRSRVIRVLTHLPVLGTCRSVAATASLSTSKLAAQSES